MPFKSRTKTAKIWHRRGHPLWVRKTDKKILDLYESRERDSYSETHDDGPGWKTEHVKGSENAELVTLPLFGLFNLSLGGTCTLYSMVEKGISMLI